MKNEIIYCLAALAMIGCADDAGVNAFDESAGAVRFSADAPSTRVAYEQTETSYRVEWVKNDRIGIFGLCAGESIGANISYTALESAAASDFAASAYSRRIRWADDASSHDFYAYYPYAEDAGSDPTAVSVSIPSVQEQSDLSSAHLAAYDILYASATDLVKGDNSIDLPFRHLGAVIEVRLTTNLRAKLEALIFRCVSNPAAAVSVENAALDLTTGKLDLSKAVTSPEVRLTAPLNTSDSEPVSLYLAVNPGHAGERFEVVAVINGKEYAVTAKTAPAGGIPAGSTAVVEGSATIGIEDALPIVDLSAAGTANTYYVGAADTFYRFRADVKGNGRALDCGTLSYGEEDLRIEPKGALVLWYNCVQQTSQKWVRRSPLLIESVNVKDDGYIYFDTPAEFVNGNAVIIALDKALTYDEVEVDADRRITNAEVLWSWNIVASEGYDPDAPENCIVKGGYTIMDRDLGAVLGYSDVYKGSWAATNHFEMASVSGNFYQWGRKDPFPGLPDYESLLADGHSGLWFAPTYTPIPALDLGTFGYSQYDREADNQLFGNTNDTASSPYAGTTNGDFAAVSVANPHLWLRKLGNWNSDMSFWGNPTAGTERKTIYDPCPPGWKVWSKNAWLAMTDDQSAEFVTADRGAILDGKWYFPFAGERNSYAKVQGYLGPCNARIPARYVVSDANYGNYSCHVSISSEFNYVPGSTEMTYAIDNKNTDNGARIRCIRDAE